MPYRRKNLTHAHHVLGLKRLTKKGANTMTKIRLVLAAAVILALSAGPLRAAQPSGSQAATANLDVLVDAIRSNRKALVAVNLKLTDEEAAKFWPIYDRYHADLRSLS
jgi:hypothetical protein